jgi:hypothetical protein
MLKMPLKGFKNGSQHAEEASSRVKTLYQYDKKLLEEV